MSESLRWTERECVFRFNRYNLRAIVFFRYQTFAYLYDGN